MTPFKRPALGSQGEGEGPPSPPDLDHALQDAREFCRGCGTAVHRSAPLCPHCGATRHDVLGRRYDKNIALLLCFCLGWFGVHKFYLNRAGAGVLYLLFFWTIVPLFIAFIDFIVLCVRSEAEINAIYGGGPSYVQ